MPNLLVLLSDQLRRQALGVHGDPDARTPHLDAFAQQGIRFDNACSTYPICVPFRFTHMTGEYAHVRKIPGIEYVMSTEERTLADEFNEAGYETIYVGKWHLDGGHGRLGSAVQVNRTRVPRSRQGRWQKWYGFELRNDPFDTCYFEDDDPGEMNNLVDDPNYRDLVAHHHRLLCERMIETEDHFVLLPAFDSEGVNVWEE